MYFGSSVLLLLCPSLTLGNDLPVTALVKENVSLHGAYDAELNRGGGEVNAWRAGMAVKF